MMLLTSLLLCLLTASTSAFHAPLAPSILRSGSAHSSQSLKGSLAHPLVLFSSHGEEDGNGDLVSIRKAEINDALTGTDRGRTVSQPEKNRIHSLISKLESSCPLGEPARSNLMNGPWIVLYTDAPPPSNGQLSLWRGIAKQVIDLRGGRYRNELYVGGSGVDEDQDAWLKAVLDASWEEWDGAYLDDPSRRAGNADYGATTWKVTFESLTIILFDFPLFTQRFKEGTARTWKMTYLDDETRIVRAGKTGKEEDDWLFYMRRGQ